MNLKAGIENKGCHDRIIAKIIYVSLLFLVFLSIQTVTCEAAVKINKREVTLVEGRTTSLKLSKTSKKVLWSSSDNSIATVNSKGKVRALSPGCATIQAKVGKKKYKCLVHVQTDYSKYYDYRISLDKVTITKVKKITDENVIIPEQIEGYPVVALQDSLFQSCSDLKTIVLPSTITEIGNLVFANCSKLETVTGTEMLTRIGEKAFYGCTKLQSVPDVSEVTELGDYAFYECCSLCCKLNLQGVTRIGKYAFYNCDRLTTEPEVLQLGTDVSEIGDYAFYDCDNLVMIATFIHVNTIGDFAFAECDNLLSVAGFDECRSFGEGCFMNCKKLSNASINGNTEVIGKSMFEGCISLYNLVLPSGLREIPERAFYKCILLKSVGLPPMLQRIKSEAFASCVSMNSMVMICPYLNDIAGDAMIAVDQSMIVYFSSDNTYLTQWVEKNLFDGKPM